jgi:exo-beta-1,3-glucanase (GH17 family)
VKREFIKGILILIAIIILSSCNINNSFKSISEIRISLESDVLIDSEKPFKIREFKPYLNDQWIGKAISYGCYRKGQAPWGTGPSDVEIKQDLNIISAYWNLIRVYNADNDTERILESIKEHSFPVKVMLGIWLEKESENSIGKEGNVNNVLRGIELARKYPEIVIAVNAGNETQVYWSGHRMESANLLKYIRVVRNNIAQPVTTADDYNFWNKSESKQIASEVDFIVTHIYPLWNSKLLNESISWMSKELAVINSLHEDKSIILGEIGWATNYNPEKKGQGQQGTLIKGDVSLQTQGEFLIMLDKWIEANRTTTFLFEAFDELWKGGAENTGSNEIEKNWGAFYENREPKQSFINYQKYVNEHNQKIRHGGNNE